MRHSLPYRSASGLLCRKALAAALFLVACLLYGTVCAVAAPASSGAGKGALLSGERDAPDGESADFVARREFRGAVRRDMAERVARTAAELAVYERGARLLAEEPDVLFAAGAQGQGGPSLDGLARMVFGVRLVALGAEGFPPFLSSVVKVALERPENYRERLIEALADEDAQELHAQALIRQRELVARYDALAPFLLALPGLEEGGKELHLSLQALVNELSGLELYLEFVAAEKANPGDPKFLKERLEQAETLASGNPLILNSLAEVWLRLDRPLTALDYSGRALAVDPGIARSHDTRGAILLRQRLPLLAAQSFGKAIELAPRNPAYYANRAAAYLILEEIDAMCRDFQRACALGDCEGLGWATEARRCEGVAQ